MSIYISSRIVCRLLKIIQTSMREITRRILSRNLLVASTKSYREIFLITSHLWSTLSCRSKTSHYIRTNSKALFLPAALRPPKEFLPTRARFLLARATSTNPKLTDRSLLIQMRGIRSVRTSSLGIRSSNECQRTQPNHKKLAKSEVINLKSDSNPWRHHKVSPRLTT